MRKVYSKCFVFHGVFCKNIHEIPAKCEIRKVYSPLKRIWTASTDKKLNVKKPVLTCMKNDTLQTHLKKVVKFLHENFTGLQDNLNHQMFL